MISRTFASVFPRQSPSSLIFSSIKAEAEVTSSYEKRAAERPPSPLSGDDVFGHPTGCLSCCCDCAATEPRELGHRICTSKYAGTIGGTLMLPSSPWAVESTSLGQCKDPVRLSRTLTQPEHRLWHSDPLIQRICRIVQSSNLPISVQVKGPQHVASADEQVLLAIDGIRLGRVADVADARMPERLAVSGVVRDQIAAAVAAEE